MKKYVVGLLLVIGSILFIPNVKVEASNCYFLNYNGICMTEVEYNNLLNMGFTESEINYMDENTYLENKDLIGHVASVSTKYYKDTYYYQDGEIITTSELVTEDEYNHTGEIILQDPTGLMQGGAGILSVLNGFTETTYKRLDAYIIEQSSNLRYKTTLNWKIMPSKRSYDIIAIGLQPYYVYSPGNRAFAQHYCTTGGACTTTNAATVKNFEGGVGATFKLPDGSMSEMSSYIYTDVAKAIGNTLTELHAYGDYSHATSNVTQSQGSNYYTVGTSGIGLYSEVSGYYDSINYANAVWYGSW